MDSASPHPRGPLAAHPSQSIGSAPNSWSPSAQASSSSLSSLGLAWASFDGRLDAHATQPSADAQSSSSGSHMGVNGRAGNDDHSQPGQTSHVSTRSPPPSYLFARPRRCAPGESGGHIRPLAGGRTLGEMRQAATEGREREACERFAEEARSHSPAQAISTTKDGQRGQSLRRFEALPLSMLSDEGDGASVMGNEDVMTGESSQDAYRGGQVAPGQAEADGAQENETVAQENEVDGDHEMETANEPHHPSTSQTRSSSPHLSQPQASSPAHRCGPSDRLTTSGPAQGLDNMHEPSLASLASLRPLPRASWRWRDTQELGLLVNLTDPSMMADEHDSRPWGGARTHSVPLPGPSRLADVSSGEITTPFATQDVGLGSGEETQPALPLARPGAQQLQMASRPVPPQPNTTLSQASQLSQPSSSTETDVSISEMTESQRERVRRLRAAAEAHVNSDSPPRPSIHGARRTMDKSFSLPTMKRPVVDDGSETEEEREEERPAQVKVRPRITEKQRAAPFPPSRKTLGARKRLRADEVEAVVADGARPRQLALTTAVPNVSRRPVRFEVDSTEGDDSAPSQPNAQRRLRSQDRRKAQPRQLFAGLVFHLVGNWTKTKRQAQIIAKHGGLVLPLGVRLADQTNPAPTHVIGCPSEGNRPFPTCTSSWAKELFGPDVKGDGRDRAELKGKEYLGILWVSECLEKCLSKEELLDPAPFRVFK